MTDHTTQGTAGLIEGLVRIVERQEVAPGTLGPAGLQYVRDAIAALSAKPAPVEAGRLVVNVEQERKDFEGYILNNRMDNPRTGSMRRSGFDDKAYEDPRLTVGFDCWLKRAERDPLYTSAPELAVADEGRLEELLDALWRAAWDRYPGARTDAANALRAYFKASRSPVQEGMVMVSRDAAAFAAGFLDGSTGERQSYANEFLSALSQHKGS